MSRRTKPLIFNYRDLRTAYELLANKQCDWLPDDIIMVERKQWRFVSEPERVWHWSRQITVPLEMTRQHANAFGRYEWIMNHRRHLVDHDTWSNEPEPISIAAIRFLASDIGLRREFPWIQPDWLHVDWTPKGLYVFLVPHYDAIKMPLTSQLDSSSVELITRHHNMALVPQGMLLLQLSTDKRLQEEQRRNIQLCMSLMVASTKVQCLAIENLRYVGQDYVPGDNMTYFTARRLHSALSGLMTAHLASPDCVFRGVSPSDGLGKDSSVGGGVWKAAAGERRQRYHALMLDAGLIFSRVLPPYVLLEIVDWLPYLWLYPHRYKIALLESIKCSVGRIKALAY